MLQKQYRLPSYVKLKNPSFAKTPFFKTRIAKNNLKVSRFGFVVSKALDKRATVRNRTKRVFRSCVEEMLPKITTGYDMLFILEKGIIGKERELMFDDLKKLIEEKRLFRD